jgi:hypothetical protein
MCNLTKIEKKILEMRRDGESPETIAHEIDYSKRHMYRFEEELWSKIQEWL